MSCLSDSDFEITLIWQDKPFRARSQEGSNGTPFLCSEESKVKNEINALEETTRKTKEEEVKKTNNAAT